MTTMRYSRIQVNKACSGFPLRWLRSVLSTPYTCSCFSALFPEDCWSNEVI